MQVAASTRHNGALKIAASDRLVPTGTLQETEALQMMATAAFACALQRAGCDVAMAKADNIDFVMPIAAGILPDARASIVFQGRSSMTVIVELRAAACAGTEAPVAVSGRFLMIAVGADGLPIPIANPDTESAEEVRT